MGDAQTDRAASESTFVTPAYYSRPKKGDQLHQGELLRQVWDWIAKYNDDTGKPDGAQAHIQRLAVVVSQECDLARDFLDRKHDPMVETDLRSILLCPAFPAEELKGQRNEMNSSFWRIVRSNKAQRYHYLAKVPAEADALGKGHDHMLVDFKSYFAVRTVELYRQIRAIDEKSAAPFTALNVPWREHLQQRFASYQARVGLPFDHFIPENRRN